MRESSGGDSWSATTDFESYSHESLLLMYQGSDAASVLRVGSALAAASTHMQSLADDLSKYVNGLAWEGEAADTFKSWARQVVQSTDTLSIYASNSAVAINMAGETLSSTKVPEIPQNEQDLVNAFAKQSPLQMTTDKYGRPRVAQPSVLQSPVVGTTPLVAKISQKDAYAAQMTLDARHQEAIGQMEKLGGSYVGANATLGVSTVPDFPPTPATLMPPKGSGIDSSGATQRGVGSGSSGVVGGGSGTVTTRKSSAPKESTGGGETKEGSTTGSFNPVTSPGQGSSEGGSTTLQGTGGPTAGPGGSPGSPSGGTGTTTGTSGGGGGGSVPPGVTGVPVGGGSSGAGGSAGGGPKGGGTPEPGGTGLGGGGGLGGSESGIHGGMPVSAGAAGTVGEGAGGLGGSAAKAPAGGVTGDMSEGSPRTGLGAAGESAKGAAGEGGSGMMPMGGGGMGGAGGRKGKRNRGRAPYLVEDEGTWERAGQPNPAVIQ